MFRLRHAFVHCLLAIASVCSIASSDSSKADHQSFPSTPLSLFWLLGPKLNLRQGRMRRRMARSLAPAEAACRRISEAPEEGGTSYRGTTSVGPYGRSLGSSYHPWSAGRAQPAAALCKKN